MQYGEIIELGRHRLMCGDATRWEDVEKLLDGQRVDLVLTDPPYGIKCQHKNGSVGGGKGLYAPILPHEFNYGRKKHLQAKIYPQLIGDDSQDAARKHYSIIKSLAPKIIMWGGQYFANFLPVSGGGIFWDKLTGNTDFSDGELAWCSFGKRVRKYTHLWNGVCRAGKRSYNPIPRVHPTQKPVELHVQILNDFSQPDDVILDCFGGSGTTLIACEITGRTCLMMELSPEYCDIIINRYLKLTEGAINFAEHNS